MFNKIAYRTQNSQKKQLTSQEQQQIFDSLNNGLFFYRKEITNQQIMQLLDTVMQNDTNCHDVTRKLANKIQHSNWQRCPGYLVERKINISQGTGLFPKSQNNYVILKHHSVIEDIQNHIFYECLLLIYPLKEYLFIPQDSALKGIELNVF